MDSLNREQEERAAGDGALPDREGGRVPDQFAREYWAWVEWESDRFDDPEYETDS